jgi:formylglycine-generating enzyme required for sulfatase activity
MSPVRTVLDEFEQLTAAILGGTATAEERARFTELSRAYPEFSSIWLEQVRLHALLTCRGESGQRAAGGQRSEAGDQRSEVRDRRPAGHVWWKIAAAAAALLFGAGAWLWKDSRPLTSDLRPLISDLRPLASALPVRLVRQTGAAGLELPAALPGTVRLEAGQATVRLGSGVALTLLGPLELEARDAMQVRLVSGRLLASVPAAASGFTVITPHLEMWDMGTVFGVSVSNGVSDVFVFRGAVQVNEVSGDAVDLCRAGEGVRAAPGWRPYKVAADWPAARALLREAGGRRSEVGGQRSEVGGLDPAAALAAAARIADLWSERNLPREALPPVPGLRGAAVSPPPGTAGRGSQVAGQKMKPITTPAREPAPGTEKESWMKGMTNTAAAVAAAAALGAAGAAYAVPEVTNVRMAQRENSRVVDVWYNLGGEPAVVTLGVETNGVPIPDSAVTRLSGDVSVVVQPGANRHIVWNAGADWPEHSVTNARARVTAWHTNAPPLYCAVDVAAGASAGTYPVYYYPSAEAVPNGVTNDLYKTLRILMRRVDPTGGAGFTMGSPTTESHRTGAREVQRQVVLTKGYYVGVYEVTQRQWQQVVGSSPTPAWTHIDYRLTRPMENVTHYEIRENPNNTDDPAVDWPDNDAVTANSFMGRMRARTGIPGFDLPTEAQWEYACRAGTAGALNDGTVNITNLSSDARLDALGRYERNGGRILVDSTWTDPHAVLGVAQSAVATDHATAKVGSYAPNAWGLYDMHGNVWEWCLDWYVEGLGTDAVEDPAGPGSSPGSFRVIRGGAWSHAASACRSAHRSSDGPSTRYYARGFRLVRTLP